MACDEITQVRLRDLKKRLQDWEEEGHRISECMAALIADLHANKPVQSGDLTARITMNGEGRAVVLGVSIETKPPPMAACSPAIQCS